MGNIQKSSINPDLKSAPLSEVVAQVPLTQITVISLLIVLDEMTRETINPDIIRMIMDRAQYRCKEMGEESENALKIFEQYIWHCRIRNPLSVLY